MKKCTFCVFLIFLFTPLFTFAQSTVLNEGFESFNIGSSAISTIQWGSNYSTDVTVQVVANPNTSGINTSTKCLRIARAQNLTITNPSSSTYRGAISASYDLTNTNAGVIEVKVLKNVAGKLAMRIYSDATNFKEIISADMVASPDWQVVRFNFIGQIVNPMTSTAKFVFQPEKNSAPATYQTDPLTVYIDDIKLDFSDNFALMRQNMIASISLGANYDVTNTDVKATLSSITNNANSYWISMSKTPATSGCLWTDHSRLTGDYSWSGPDVRASVDRLLVMAQAYGLTGSGLYHNSTLLTDLVNAITFIDSVAYNANTPYIGNWYEWNIAIPLSLDKIISILYTNLSDTLKSRYYSTIRTSIYKNIISQTYANTSAEAEALLYEGVLSNNLTDVQNSINYLDKVFIDTTTIAGRKKGQAAFVIQWQTQVRNNPTYNDLKLKEGLYDDGTFIQHFAIPYVGVYGEVIIHSAADFSSVLKGSGFALSSPLKASLIKWMDGAYLPAIYEGEMMKMFMGRGVFANPHGPGKNILIDIASTANQIGATDSTRIKSICKRMLTNDNYFTNIYSGTPLTTLPILKSLLNNPTIPTAINSNFSKVLSAGDRVIHNRTDYRFGISMSSSRIGKFESINGDNPTGWYLGDGMTYLYNSDRNQYVDYLINVDFYKLPGTTVDTIARSLVSLPGVYTDGNYSIFGVPKNAKDWVGGTSLRGLYSVAGMDLVSEVSTLEAKKSWFMFDNEIVALGAGITMSESRAPITIIENRNRLGSSGSKIMPNLTIDGVVKSTTKGWSEKVVSPKWACLDGTGGYYFPGNYTITVSRGQNGFTQMLIDHGLSPVNADYSYVLLPNATTQSTSTYAAAPDVQILCNTKDLQAVKEKKLNIISANFWVAGQIDILTTNNPASVMLQKSNDSIYFSVSDPTWLQTSLTLSIDGNYKVGTGTDATVTAIINGTKTNITIDVTDKIGMTQKAVFISQNKTEITEVGNSNKLVTYFDSETSLLKLYNLPDKQCAISLINVAGVEFKKDDVYVPTATFEVSKLNTGVYIVLCRSISGELYVGKIIKH